ncbi:MAG: gliding motility-associated C-terminal domain-containing protein [Flavobacteriales bacterium]|nr:gliding motility-associated C-terminal domain-containing protein [Flavobacteriales bacterium]
MKNGLIRICTAILCLFHFGTFAQCGDCEQLVELVTNGNFSSGNNGFSSDLNYVTGFFCPLCPENTYTVGANATFYHSDFTGSDHTNPPFGNFFIANGSAVDGASVWCQSFAVQPGVDYTFSFWARDVTNNSNAHPLALLEPVFNGIPAGDTLQASGGWQQFTFTWNSGSETYLDLCIINHQSLSGGNDFGLDDISLSACENIILSQTADAGPDLVLCSHDIAQIGQTSLNGYSYQWDNATGLSATNLGNPQFFGINETTSSQFLTYILTTDSAGVGCITTDTVSIELKGLPGLDLGPNEQICPGNTITLDAGNNWDSLLWSGGETTPVIEVGAGDYAVTAYYNGCDTTDQISITEVVMPIIELGNDTTICEGSSLLLNAGVIGWWNGSILSDTLGVINAGNYQFTYTNGPCTTSDDIDIAVTPLPEVNISSENEFCQGSTLTITASTSGLWSTGESGTSITVNEGGYYDIVVVNLNCTRSAGIDVVMNPLPIMPEIDNLSICEDDSVPLDAYHEYNQYYLWSNGDTTSYTTLSGAGYYEVQVGNACDTSEVEFYLDTYRCNWGLYIPSAFTPNEDDINEGWAVEGYNVTEVRIHVYNRFGDLIFYTDELGKKWQPGTGVGDDVYNYYVTAKTFDGEDFEEKGRLYLLR